MYKVKLGDDIDVFDTEIPGLQLINPVLTQELNKAGLLTFKLPASHKYYDSFTPLFPLINVYKDNALVFRGRIVDEKCDFFKTKTISAEGAMAFLNDTIIRPFDYTGSLDEFLSTLITAHNESVQPFQRFKIGDVTVTDDYVHYSSTEYLKTWDVIKSRILDTHGGFLRVRYDAFGRNVIDYLADFDSEPVREIHFGENLLSLLQSRSATKTYTACIPLGAESTCTDMEGETTKTRLTIKSVNNGQDYILNDLLAQTYGIIFAPTEETTWDNVTEASNLIVRGKTYLADLALQFKDTLTVEAAQLGGAAELINFCDRVHIKSVPHNVDITLVTAKIAIPLYAPEKTRLTLGRSGSSMLRILGGQKIWTQHLTDILQQDIMDTYNPPPPGSCAP